MEASEREPSGSTHDTPSAAPMDIRFNYANERTFLAWNRTALALITAGLAITQLLPPFDFPGGRTLIGLPLIGLGILLPIWSLVQWRSDEQDMSQGRAPRPSFLPWIVGVVIGAAAVIAAVLVVATGRT